MLSSKVHSATGFLLACVFSLSLVGCTLETTASPGSITGAAITGKVHGGQQPIVGAHIYLMAANTTGYGGPNIAPSALNASISLLTTLTGHSDSLGNYVTSAADASFTITGDYTCLAGQQVYLYALGGNPGSGTNPNSALMATLGSCPGTSFSSTLNTWVNEVTTIATAYAFAGFASDATHVSSSGSTLAQTGIANAFANAANLVNPTTGAALLATPPGNGFVPQQELNTLANILASCVNTTGTGTGTNPCNTLFASAKSSGASGTAPTDTATAAIYIAHFPAANVAALYSIPPPAIAFGNALTTQPNDFTLGINITNSNCFNNAAHGLAIDASGSAWSLGGHGICKFSNNGTPLTSYYGFNFGACFSGGLNLAIDTIGNVWVPDYGYSRLCEISNSGTAVSTNSGYTGGGISSPRDVAIDSFGNVWIANQTGTLSKFTNTGGPVSTNNGYSDGGNNVAFLGVAIDASGNVWAANSSNGSISEFSSNGTAMSPTTGYYGGGIYTPYDIAIDGYGNVWTANSGNDSLSKFSSSGSALSPTGAYGGYKGGGFNSPESIAIDSAGNAWAGNSIANTVSVITNTGGAISSYPAYSSESAIYAPVSIALDGSGNVWVTNSNGSLTELIGAGAPVVTPIAANLVLPYGSAAVNRP